MYRISVLMGIYNCEFALSEALDSLYAQSFQDFKIILCDDGSTDDTFIVANSYADKHANIVLIKNEKNMGLNYTLNRCLEFADTEYCARMDGDDISMPTRFEKEIKFLDEHIEYAIVSCPMIYFDEEGDFKRGKGFGEPEKNSFIKGTPFCHAPCMIRTKAIKQIGGYSISPKLLRVEDYHLWIKMYDAGFRGFMLSECLYKMRDDRYATTRRTWKNRKNEIYVRFIAAKVLHIPFYYWPHILRPLFVYITPSFIYNYFHHKS